MNSPPRSDRNGPGESKAANIGISLPGTGEAPRCPVYIDGKKDVTLEGTYDELAAAFRSERSRRIEGRQYRHQPPRYGGSAAMPCLHRRQEGRDARRHLR